MNGLCQIGLVGTVFKDATEWKAYGIEMLEKRLDIQIYPDGFQFELSTAYQHAVVENYLKVVKVFRCYDEAIPATFLKKLEKVVDLNLKLVISNA